MNEYQKVQRMRLFMANQLAMYVCYDKWSDEFCRQDAMKMKGIILESLGRVDLCDFTAKELRELQFGLWEEEGPYLLPLYLYPFLEYGQELVAIDGERVTVQEGYDDIDSDHYIDNEVRGGFTAYGVMPEGE